jgi:tight adherence protein B
MAMGDTAAILLQVQAFLFALLLVEGIYLAVQRLGADRGQALRRRLRAIGDAGHGQLDADAESIVRVERGGWRKRLASVLPRRGSLEILLYQSGSSIGAAGFVVLTALAGAAGLALGLGIAPAPVAPLLGVAFALAPRGWFGMMRRRRMRRFEYQLPQALELFTRALRAGHGVGFGFQMVGEELPDPVGTEFAHVAEEVGLGMDLRQALANLARRMDTQDVAFFVTAVLIQRETGGNLAEILDNLGRVVRERIKFHGKLRSLVAQTRASANILLVMPLVMVGALSIVNVTYVEPLWTTQEGRWLAMASAAAVSVGWALCRKLAVVRP